PCCRYGSCLRESSTSSLRDALPICTYLYLITALHILHLAGGIIFLSYLFFKTAHVVTDGIRSLIFIRDPYRSLQLSMLTSYWQRSEEHTSELQSRENLVCRLLLENK